MATAKEKTLEAVRQFHLGTNTRAFELLGAHPASKGSVRGYRFRTWAPEATAVTVVGDFNGWDPAKDPMKRRQEDSVWECFVPGAEEGAVYKYCITTPQGNDLLKADPYSFWMEIFPDISSRLCGLSYQWEDAQWMRHRGRTNPVFEAMNLYEVHLGSWKKWGKKVSYQKLAKELVGYAAEMGYTHLQLLPVAEFASEGTWGYQTSGYFAPTSRYGKPEELMHLIDCCHQAGLGVIIDWVPTHFPKDPGGLYLFDGSCCYEYADAARQEHAGYNARVFDYGKGEVASFLLSSARFWLEQYHVDGLIISSLDTVLHLDSGKASGQWKPNIYGGRENLEAVALLRSLGTMVQEDFPGAVLVAEDINLSQPVTRPLSAGGLGFTFLWNDSWRSNVLDYMSLEPGYRTYHPDKLTYNLLEADSENYILPISHDDVVLGDRSLLMKLPGSMEEKLAGLRALYGYMMAYPGKKLTFMGSEFGQLGEWDHRGELEWELLKEDGHRKLRRYVKDLNAFYKQTPSLWQIDNNREGYDWIDHSDHENNVISFCRRDDDGQELLVICNFSLHLLPAYRIGVPPGRSYKVAFSSDKAIYGGSGLPASKALRTEKVAAKGLDQSIALDLPPLSVVYLSCNRKF